MEEHTLQSTDSPRLKLLERDLSYGWHLVVIESVIVRLLREFSFCELFLLVVDVGATFGVDAGVVVADHDEYRELLLCWMFWSGLRVEDAGWKVKWNANAFTRCTDRRVG
jgi:hypothetical protein